MARTFRDRDTLAVAEGKLVPRFHAVQRRAEERLAAVLDAASLQDLRIFPGYRLEALKGNRRGQYSIRINAQWRICFEWSSEEQRAVNIEIVDYH